MFRITILLYILSASLGFASTRELIYASQLISKGVGFEMLRDTSFQEYTFYGNKNVALDGSGVNVAIIGSGVNISSPYLLKNFSYESSHSFHSNSNSRYGYNLLNDTYFPYDDEGEGTFTAGIITTAAPGVTILPFKVSKNNKNTDVNLIIKAVEKAIGYGVKVINLSLSGIDRKKLDYRFWYSIHDIIGSKAILIVGAQDNQPEYLGESIFPEAINSPSLISVCSIDRYGNRTKKLIQSSNSTDVCALGKDVYSLGLGGVHLEKRTGSNYAAPFVTALAAMLYQVNPQFTPIEIKRLITSGVEITDQLDGPIRSGGYISFDKTLKKVLR